MDRRLRHLTDSLITKACATIDQPPPARVGPQTLRNTIIVNWLNSGLPPASVAQMAGLKNTKGLYHLRAHVHQDVRGQLNLGNHRDDQSPTMAEPA